MMRRRSLQHVKRTKAKGKEYFYFRTGQFNEQGNEILTKLPHISDVGFGASYASCLAGRARRENAQQELTVTALCDLWEKSHKWTRSKADGGYAEGTKKIYRISLDYLKSQLPTAPAGLVERSDIALLMDKRADNPGAANSVLRTLNSLYKWARERGHVTNDPGKDVRELPVGEHQPWPEHVLNAALSATPEKPDEASKLKADRVRLATHLLYYTAQRIEDVVNIRWTDIRDGVLYVKQKKTGRELEIPVHSSLVAELQRHPGRIGYIIPGIKAKPLHQSTLRDVLQAFANERGTKVVPHGLRKNAVNALLEAGCSSAETASISGQSLQMVEHYAKGRAQGKLAGAAILKWQGHKK